MSPVNIPPEGKGSITLRGYCFIQAEKQYKECLIIEASSVTQSAVVQVLGSLFMQAVPFRNIANIALKYDNGEIAQNFGAPRVSRPASLEFIPSPETWHDDYTYTQEFDIYSDADPGL